MLDENNIEDDQIIIVDNSSTIYQIKESNINTNTKLNIEQNNQNSTYKFDPKILKENGKCGIRNLGNTCYMNSALQILSHTKELVEFFLAEKYKNELKSEDDNILNIYIEEEKNKNLFVKNFAEFMKAEWFNTASYKDAINPIDLRKPLSKIYPQFQENTQQDAHEFLICILDLFHQQLNRKENKNGTIIDETNLILTHQNSFKRHLSQRCWESHQQINDSYITDLFFGQLKSTIKCMNCKYENYAFDPFSNLGLPIPIEYKTLIYFIPLHKNEKPVRMFVKVNDNMQFKNLIEIVRNNLLDYHFNNAIFYFVLNQKMIKLIDLEERCGDLLNRQNFLFMIESEDEMISHIDSISPDEDKFYVCLNFFMFEDQSQQHENKLDMSKNIRNTNRKEINYKSKNLSDNKSDIKFKSASFPRIFSYDFSKIQKENSESNLELVEDKKVFLKIFNFLISYVKPYIKMGQDFQELVENKLLNFTVKSVEEIYYTDEKEKKFQCLFCGEEKEESFQCCCINRLIYKKDTFDSQTDFSNSTLTYYLKNRKLNQDFILDVNINISTDIIKYKELNKCKDNTQKFQQETKSDLIDLLDYFTAEEKLTLQENFHCNNCDQNVVAYKKMEINKFPNILVFHLKRFRFNENLSNNRFRISRRSEGNYSQTSNGFAGEKNENMIDFKINNLELDKYNKGNKLTYELFAVCNHSGKLDSGHYTALCKHPYTGKWLEYDDKLVKERSIDSIVTPNAYMLFYRQKNIK